MERQSLNRLVRSSGWRVLQPLRQNFSKCLSTGALSEDGSELGKRLRLSVGMALLSAPSSRAQQGVDHSPLDARKNLINPWMDRFIFFNYCVMYAPTALQ